MQGPPNNNNPELSQALGAIYTLIEGLRNDNTQLKLTTGGLHAKVVTVEEQNAKMNKIVVEGNGQRPLTTRIVLIEDTLNNIQKDYKEQTVILKDELVNIKDKLNELEDIGGNHAKAAVAFGLDITKTLLPMALAAIVSLAFSGFVSSLNDKRSQERDKEQQEQIESGRKIVEQNRQLIDALRKQNSN